MERWDSRRGTLIRRHSRHSSRSISFCAPDTDEDSEHSRCPSPLLVIEGGYRVNPFMVYPVQRASKGVRFMADYCQYIYTPSTRALTSRRHSCMGASASSSIQHREWPQYSRRSGSAPRLAEFDAIRGNHSYDESSMGIATRIRTSLRQNASQTSRFCHEGAPR
jgi:hypothetical protein